MSEPDVLCGPDASARMKRGFDQIAEVLALTLGPTQGTILSQHETRPQPEMLTDAATIARRILALPDRAEDVGAMLARNLVWRMHLKAGDGCATAAVLAQAILEHAHRMKAAGANPMALRRGIDCAAAAAIDTLRRMSRPIKHQLDLAKVTQTILNDANLSRVLVDIYAKLGPDAYVSIEDYMAPYLERQFYEGGRWKGRLASPYLITDPARRRAVLSDCLVVLYAGDVADIKDLQPVLELAARTESKSVALIANEIKDVALTALIMNHQQGRLKMVGAELRENESKRRTDYQDLAVLTGAEVLSPETGRHLRDIQPGDVGHSPRVEADPDELIVVGSGRIKVGHQIETLRARLERLYSKGNLQSPDDEAMDELRFRMARLGGQVAKLMIGAYTEAERTTLRQKAEKALRALPIALREGLVPGGGVAYLNCIPAVLDVSAAGDEAMGVKSLAYALEEPFRRIATNAGASAPGAVMAQAQRRGPAYGYDAIKCKVVSMEKDGILDAAGVLIQALQTAVSGAIMALTTETIVLKSNPQTSMEP
jgi:chaperonin GroEL